MGTFAETAIVDYRLSFFLPSKINFRFPFPFAANKRNFAVSVFRLQQTNENCRFPFAECRKHGDGDMENEVMETRRHRYMETWRHRDIETWRHGGIET